LKRAGIICIAGVAAKANPKPQPECNARAADHTYGLQALNNRHRVGKLQKKGREKMSAQELKLYLNTREENVVRFLGTPTLVRATGESTRGAFGLVEQLMVPPGFASPYHVHHLEDESFYSPFPFRIRTSPHH
jgi:hypothetical protein